MARNSMANQSKYHLLLEEQSSLSEEVGEVEEEVSEVVVEEGLILTSRVETGLVPTVLVVT